MPLFYNQNRMAVYHDVLLELRPAGEAVRTATGSDTARLFNSSIMGHAHAVIDTAAVGGTIDAANTWRIDVEISATGSAWSPIASYTLTPGHSVARRVILSLNQYQAAQIVNNAQFMRTTATKVGTTAGNLQFQAYLSPVDK